MKKHTKINSINFGSVISLIIILGLVCSLLFSLLHWNLLSQLSILIALVLLIALFVILKIEFYQDKKLYRLQQQEDLKLKNPTRIT